MTTCPNNVWNHTNGCACAPNGSVLAEADLDISAASSAPFRLSSRDKLTVLEPADLRVGDVVVLEDSEGGWDVATVTSLDNDHKSTSVELDGDEGTIATYGPGEVFVRVERGARDWVEPTDQDMLTEMAREKYHHRLINAEPGDIVTDVNGEDFVRGSSTSIRYYVGCGYCDRMREADSSFFPSHEPSPTCRSGGRNHCTCNACF